MAKERVKKEKERQGGGRGEEGAVRESAGSEAQKAKEEVVAGAEAEAS